MQNKKYTWIIWNKQTNKLKSRQHWPTLLAPLCHLWPEVLRSVSWSVEHQEFADFELCEVRSYLNHVCTGLGRNICLCVCQPVSVHCGTLSLSSSELAFLLSSRGGSWLSLGKSSDGTWTPCWPWILQQRHPLESGFVCRIRLLGVITTSEKIPYKLLPLEYRCLM